MRPRLIERANSRDVTRLTTFVQTAGSIDLVELRSEYEELVATAPRRHEHGLRYLVDHSGITSSASFSNRLEEHLAVAIFRERSFAFGEESMSIVDYQVPLKSRRSDEGVGKIDLLGLHQNGALQVIELKITPQNARSPETPLRAIIESLAYAAILEANLAEIISEIREAGHETVSVRPEVMVAAPTAYWDRIERSAPGWHPQLRTFMAGLGSELSVNVRLVDLGSVSVEPGLDGEPPVLIGGLDVWVM